MYGCMHECYVLFHFFPSKWNHTLTVLFYYFMHLLFVYEFRVAMNIQMFEYSHSVRIFEFDF